MYLDAIIIGAGFSGLYQLHKCRDQLGLKTLVIEEGKDIGGTWYWNKYPGSRCDTESHIYCYTFSEDIYKNWKWKERYPKQKEILSYLKYVEKKLRLRKNIIFNNKVISADYLDKKNLLISIKFLNQILISKEIYIFLFLISAIFSAILYFISNKNIVKAKCLIEKFVRKEITNLSLNIQWEYYIKMSQGDISKSILSEGQNISEGYMYFISAITYSFIAITYFSACLLLVPDTFFILIIYNYICESLNYF